MILIDGDRLAREILEGIKAKQLKLAVILVDKSEVSKSYISKKREMCEKVGIGFELFNFSLDAKQEEIKNKIEELNNDKSVSGIVVQLPLPKNIDTPSILNAVLKDPDVLSEASFNNFSKNIGILPPVVKAIKYIFDKYRIDLNGKKIVLIGKGRLVGKPLSVWLSSLGADFKIVDRSTESISDFTKDADIIISGAGSSGIIQKDMVKEGVILIDAGTSSEEGKVKGDIDKEAYGKASYVAPVPGGLGPLTVACLIDNLAKLE